MKNFAQPSSSKFLMKNGNFDHCKPSLEAGFSMIEMLVSLFVLISVLGVVFSYVGRVQRVYKAQETSVDNTEQARTFLDGIERELHQAGYPNRTMYALSVLPASPTPTTNDAKVAAGVVAISPWNLVFEGDIDGDGAVESVRYTLLGSNGAIATGASNCPCTLQRTVRSKAAAAGAGGVIAPITVISDADVTNIGTAAINNVINSGDQNNSNPLALTGGNGSGASFNVAYAAYKTAPIFNAFHADGSPVNFPPSASDLATIRSITVVVNSISGFDDTQSKTRIPLSMRTSIRLTNF